MLRWAHANRPHLLANLAGGVPPHLQTVLAVFFAREGFYSTANGILPRIATELPLAFICRVPHAHFFFLKRFIKVQDCLLQTKV